MSAQALTFSLQTRTCLCSSILILWTWNRSAKITKSGLFIRFKTKSCQKNRLGFFIRPNTWARSSRLKRIKIRISTSNLPKNSPRRSIKTRARKPANFTIWLILRLRPNSEILKVKNRLFSRKTNPLLLTAIFQVRVLRFHRNWRQEGPQISTSNK